METLHLFSHRVIHEWLPTYCADAKRGYGADGFNPPLISTVSEADARDCMLAIDQGVVIDTGGGRYRANRNSAHEVLFWEGRKNKSPRPISLWLEPVITFAALARLHTQYRWPKESLGTQPPGWAFDLAAYCNESDDSPRILGEVKKSSLELRRLRDDFIALSNGASPDTALKNSLKKWHALLAMKPSVVWLLGPAEEEFTLLPTYTVTGAILREVPNSALEHTA